MIYSFFCFVNDHSHDFSGLSRNGPHGFAEMLRESSKNKSKTNRAVDRPHLLGHWNHHNISWLKISVFETQNALKSKTKQSNLILFEDHHVVEHTTMK